MQRCSLRSITTLIILTLLVILSINYQEILLGIGIESIQSSSNNFNINLINNGSFLSRLISSNSFRDYSYIHTVFRVSNDEIRVTFIRSYQKHEPVYYKLGNSTGIVRFECVLPSCLDAFSKPCNMIGYVGIIREAFNDSITTVEFSSKNQNEFQISVGISDVRVTSEIYPHQLAVCVQPVYLHADYVLFIHFFEFWISQGATKFYIYRESYTTEVQKIIDFYNETGNIEIEMIDWSLLPTYKGVSMNNNPNAYIYRLEMMLSIFDCIHRSRSNTKFVVQTDLDELIFIKNGQRVVDFMEDYSEKEPLFSSVSFRSQRISFDEVKLENYVFDRPYYSKLIYRPERVFRVHSHQQFPPERIPKKNSRYKNKLINSTDGVVLHMRRSADTFKWKNLTNSDILSSLASVWNESYLDRVSRYDFGDGEWKNIGVQMVREVDSCRKQVYKNKDKKCHNVLICEEKLSKKYSDAFIHSNNSWYFV